MAPAGGKRCRQARPLTGVGRLAERERPGGVSVHQCSYQVALGAQHSPTPVKGGIAPAGAYDAVGVASAFKYRVAVHSGGAVVWRFKGGGGVGARSGGGGGAPPLTDAEPLLDSLKNKSHT